MKPLRRVFIASFLPVALAAAAFAQPRVESPAAGAAPSAALTPQSVGAMASAVTAFFSPANADPRPGDLSGIIATLQRVGTPAGPTRAQMQPVLDRIGLAATRFDGLEPLETPAAPGLAASVQLELLAGPLRAWLSEGQKETILQKQAEYGAKLSSADRRRLSAKMKAMADALSAGALSSEAAEGPSVRAELASSASGEKVSLWREHGSLSAWNGNRQIDPHDLFADAGDLFSRPDASLVTTAKPATRGWRASLRRLLEKAGAAAYLSGTVSPEGIQTARSILETKEPAQASSGAPVSPRFADIEAFAQQMDDDYFNAHGFYPAGAESRRKTAALAEPVVAPVPAAIAPARASAALAGGGRDAELDEFIQRMDDDYYNTHGYYPGRQLILSFPRQVRGWLIELSPVMALALFVGLLSVPGGVAILVGLARIAGGVFLVLLARKLGLRSVSDIPSGWPAWLARALAIGMDLAGGLLILMTVATMAGLLPH